MSRDQVGVAVPHPLQHGVCLARIGRLTGKMALHVLEDLLVLGDGLGEVLHDHVVEEIHDLGADQVAVAIGPFLGRSPELQDLLAFDSLEFPSSRTPGDGLFRIGIGGGGNERQINGGGILARLDQDRGKMELGRSLIPSYRLGVVLVVDAPVAIDVDPGDVLARWQPSQSISSGCGDPGVTGDPGRFMRARFCLGHPEFRLVLFRNGQDVDSPGLGSGNCDAA